ncbi:MAG: hypothetical protein WC824_11275 [Bacteroidota bacterium]
MIHLSIRRYFTFEGWIFFQKFPQDECSQEPYCNCETHEDSEDSFHSSLTKIPVREFPVAYPVHAIFQSLISVPGPSVAGGIPDIADFTNERHFVSVPQSLFLSSPELMVVMNLPPFLRIATGNRENRRMHH